MSNMIIGNYLIMNESKTICISIKNDIDLGNYLKLDSRLLLFLNIPFKMIRQIKREFNKDLLNDAVKIVEIFQTEIIAIYYLKDFPLVIETALGWCICIAPLEDC